MDRHGYGYGYGWGGDSNGGLALVSGAGERTVVGNSMLGLVSGAGAGNRTMNGMELVSGAVPGTECTDELRCGRVAPVGSSRPMAGAASFG